MTIAAMDLEDKEAAFWKDCAASLVLIHLVFIQFMPEAPAPESGDPARALHWGIE
jgi:hypothetical protein